MDGLPLDIDLDFMIGTQLIQVAIGENEVVLHLEPPTSIAIGGAIRLNADRGHREHLDAATIGTALVPLLGESIREASAQAGGVMRIVWSSGAVLDLLDSWDQYESYTVTHDGRVIVV